MAGSTSRTDVLLVETAHSLAVAPEVVWENILDVHHIPNIHADTFASCEVLQEFPGGAAVVATLKPVRWLPWLRQTFVVIRKDPEGLAGEATYVSLPVSTRFASHLVIRVRPVARGTGSASHVEHSLRFRLSWWLRPFKRVVLALRARGENARWAQDAELMLARQAALDAGHVGRPECLPAPRLLHDWFGLSHRDPRSTAAPAASGLDSR